MTTSDQSQAAPTSPAPSPEPQNVRNTFTQVLASLVAAVSLLKSGGKAAKKAAPSDKMFDQMILDYERAIEQGRAALAQSDAEPVAWRYAYPGYPNSWNLTSEKLVADERKGNVGCIVEPLYTAPPRPDASEHGEIPDCPTEGVAARQGNGG